MGQIDAGIVRDADGVGEVVAGLHGGYACGLCNSKLTEVRRRSGRRGLSVIPLCVEGKGLARFHDGSVVLGVGGPAAVGRGVPSLEYQVAVGHVLLTLDGEGAGLALFDLLGFRSRGIHAVVRVIDDLGLEFLNGQGDVRLGRSILFPHGVQGLRNRTTVITGDGLGHKTGAARLTGRATVFGVAPAHKGVVFTGGSSVRNVECMALGILFVRSPGLLGGGATAAVGIILQREVPQIAGAASTIGIIPVNPICHRTSTGIGRPLYGCSGLLIATGEVPVSNNLSDAAKLAGINKVCKWGDLVVSTLNLSRLTCTGGIRTDGHCARRRREHANGNRNGSAAGQNRAVRTPIAVITVGRRGALFRVAPGAGPIPVFVYDLLVLRAAGLLGKGCARQHAGHHGDHEQDREQNFPRILLHIIHSFHKICDQTIVADSLSQYIVYITPSNNIIP